MNNKNSVLAGIENIPHELRKEKRFVLYGWELVEKPRSKNDKPKHIKIAHLNYNPSVNQRIDPSKVPLKGVKSPASSTNPDTWLTYDQACTLLNDHPEHFRGVGFVLTGSEYTCIDLDHMINKGVLNRGNKAVYWVLEHFQDCYMEVSQSGEGLHIFVKARKAWDASKFSGIEVYSGKFTDGSNCGGRYIALTGNVFRQHDVMPETDQTEKVTELLEKFGPKKPEPVTPVPASTSTHEKTDVFSALMLLNCVKNDPAYKEKWAVIEQYNEENGFDRNVLLPYFHMDNDPSTGDSSKARYSLMEKLAFYGKDNDELIFEAMRGTGLYINKARETSVKHAEDLLRNELAKVRAYANKDNNSKNIEEIKENGCPVIPFTVEQPKPFPLKVFPEWARNHALVHNLAEKSPFEYITNTMLSVVAFACSGRFTVEGENNKLIPLNLFIVIADKPSQNKSSILNYYRQFIVDYEKDYNIKIAPEIAEKTEEIRQQNERIKGLQKAIDKLQHLLDTGIDTQEERERNEKEISNLKVKIAEAEEIKRTIEVPKKRNQLMGADLTPESIPKRWEQNYQDNVTSLWIASSEGRSLLQVLEGKYTNGRVTSVSHLNNGYDGDFVTVDRSDNTKSVSFDEAHMNMMIFTQRDSVKGIMENPEFDGSGLTPRLFLIQPNEYVDMRRECVPMDPFTKRDFQEFIETLMIPDPVQKKEAKTLHLSPDAFDRYKEFYVSTSFLYALPDNQLAEYEYMETWLGKARGVVLRLAGILHIFDTWENVKRAGLPAHDQRDRRISYWNDDSPISLDTMNKAIELWDYYFSYMKMAYRETDNNDILILDALWNRIREECAKKGRNSLTLAEIKKALRRKEFKNVIRENRLYELLEMLCKHYFLINEKDVITKNTVFIVNKLALTESIKDCLNDNQDEG